MAPAGFRVELLDGMQSGAARECRCLRSFRRDAGRRASYETGSPPSDAAVGMSRARSMVERATCRPGEGAPPGAPWRSRPATPVRHGGGPVWRPARPGSRRSRHVDATRAPCGRSRSRRPRGRPTGRGRPGGGFAGRSPSPRSRSPEIPVAAGFDALHGLRRRTSLVTDGEPHTRSPRRSIPRHPATDGSPSIGGSFDHGSSFQNSSGSPRAGTRRRHPARHPGAGRPRSRGSPCGVGRAERSGQVLG